ncbi:MAG: GNAT family N-acetyltransferase [Rickettsiales bacterium]
MSVLIIREPKIEDKNAFISAMQSSQDLHNPWVAPPKTEIAFDDYILRSRQANQKCFLLCDDSSNIIGVFNISEIVLGQFQSAYLGFYAIANYEGKGYMSRGIKLVLKNIFEEMRLHRIEANIQPGNNSSINLVKANGFIKEGYSALYLKVDGLWRDHERYALTYESWVNT